MGGMGGMGGMGDIGTMLNNSSIGKLAQDIAKQINLDDMNLPKEGEEVDMQKLLNPENFMSMFSKINEQVQEKLTTGEIDDSVLSQEAETMMPAMANNPLFQTMMSGDLFKNIAEEN